MVTLKPRVVLRLIWGEEAWKGIGVMEVSLL